MAFPDTVAYTPNLNFYRLTGGDMAASAGASALAAEALAAAMIAELTSLGVNTSSTATIGWAGEGGATMTLSAAQMMDVFGLAIAWLQEHAAAATSIVEAHQTAAQTMVPGPVCDQNREDYAMLAGTNWFGQNTMPMGALDFAYFGEHWPHNATAMAVYQSVVEAALAILSTPPPMDPVASNPAGALAGVAQAAAQAAGHTALQTGAQTMSATAEAPVAAGQGASSTMSTMMQSMSSVVQMPMQMMSSLPQMLSQAPQMLGQVMQTGMGLLGPLMQGMGAANPADAASLAGSATPGLGGLPGGAAGLGGGGGGGFGLSGASPVASTFTRPASSFNTPNAPKLPGGWGGTTGAPEPVATPGAASGMGGNGGLYGAPHAAGREGERGADRKTPARTMQLTGRPEYGRGE